ncbi:MAG: DUF2846 domain-containing protein [Acidobacteriaceae bacterium]
MKIIAVAILLAISAFAQPPTSIVKDACGPLNVKFEVYRDTTKHTAKQADPGKARIYFVQDIGSLHPLGIGGSFTTRVGVDGEWVGANQNDSYFSVSVDPGEHHLCVNAQMRIFGQVMEFAHFTAEAGKTYYFRTRNFMWQTQRLDFGATDSDQALYMIASYPLSISQPSK